MCGINGIHIKRENTLLSSTIKKMNDAIAHRGPDDAGIFIKGNFAFGHRRLSIIDLSSAGHQPMESNDGRYQIVYNGELYNYKELKFELERAEHGTQNLPYSFKTNTDTEVILAAYIRWGADCLKYFNGMFAFAIFDTQLNKIFISRDRMGVKPLYYYNDESVFVFSSELRAILKSGLIKRKLNNASVADYLMYQTVHAPDTIIEGVKALMPAHQLSYEDNTVSINSYWNINKVVTDNKIEYTDAKANVKNLFFKSVERRLVADVPFGAFLSGGIDSSAVVAAMANVSAAKVNTFSVTFNESDYSEARYAEIVSKKYDTLHHEIKLTANDFLKSLPDALSAMDSPSGDGPNTFVVSKATKNAGITMALSGIGGDELFAGYDVFKRQVKINKFKWVAAVPSLLKSPITYLNYKYKRTISSKKMHLLLSSDTLSFADTFRFSRMVLFADDLQKILKTNDSNSPISKILKQLPKTNDIITLTSLAEIQTYMQNTLLRDTDQMSMASALEVREPFLDYKLVEYVLSLSDDIKFPHTPKKLFVDALKNELPDEIVNRKKMGFTFPWQQWMQNELKLFCEEALHEYKKFSVFNYNEIMLLWHRFLKNDKLITWSRVWHIVVLAHWLKLNEIEE
jgi:asparagine synthase (glutamine-hydrolysing)